MKIKLNVSKINKDKIIKRTFTNNEGTEVEIKEYSLDLVPLREKKFVTEGETWVMYKTHILVESQTKEEKAQKQKGVIVGEGIEFENKEPVIEDVVEEDHTAIDPLTGRDLNTEDSPF